MNNFLKVSILIFLSVASACNRTVNGTGPIVTETRSLDNATAIELSVPARVTLIKADSFSCIIGAQQNILDLIKTDTDGNDFIIKSDKNFNTEKPVDIVISMPTIEGLVINGSGEINCPNPLHEKELVLEINGSGKLKLGGKIIDLSADIRGSGEMYVNGKCEQQKITISGSGYYYGFALETERTKVNISGSGNAEVTVADELNAEISGSGNVQYKGDPHLKTDISGSGNVKKID